MKPWNLFESTKFYCQFTVLFWHWICVLQLEGPADLLADNFSQDSGVALMVGWELDPIDSVVPPQDSLLRPSVG